MSDVIDLRKRPPKVDHDRTLESVRYTKCRHNRFLVDEKKAEVECVECGSLLNPIWVLGQLANHESNLAQRRDKLRALVKQLGDRVRYKCRSCGHMNDMARIVKVKRRGV